MVVVQAEAVAEGTQLAGDGVWVDLGNRRRTEPGAPLTTPTDVAGQNLFSRLGLAGGVARQPRFVVSLAG